MTYRVWERQWVAVYTSDADGAAGKTECEVHFEDIFEGNVREKEWRVIDQSDFWPATLELYLPVVIGEETDIREAEALQNVSVVAHDADSWIAELGSALDKELESYGRKKLPA